MPSAMFCGSEGLCEVVPLNDSGRDSCSFDLIETIMVAGWSGWRVKLLLRTSRPVSSEWLFAAKFVFEINGQRVCCETTGLYYDDPLKLVVLVEPLESPNPEGLESSLGSVIIIAPTMSRGFFAA